MHRLDFTNIEAVVFDFDGVILDSAGVKSAAFPALFAHRPEFTAAILAHHLDNQGISRYQKFSWIFENLFKEPLTEERSQELGQQFSDLVYHRVVASPFIPGALKLLKWLSEQRIPSFVASGTPVDELRRIVDARQLGPYFTEVEGSPKTKVEIVNEIKERYGFRGERMLFVGDATTDYEAAKATSVPFVAVDTPDMHDYWVGEEVILSNDLAKLVEQFERVTA